MNYEERYNQALERAKSVKDNDITLTTYKAVSEFIFPELRESEDERIRKAILKMIIDMDGGYPFEKYGIIKKKALAWLEKQGEKMSDQRHGILDKLIEADNIYQMAMNDAMVEEAKNKAIEALSKLGISKLLGLEKQGELKPTPKFKIGDTIHKIGENTVFPRTIEKIEDGDYVCNNSHSFVNIKFQDDYELVEQEPAWSEEDEEKLNSIIEVLGNDSLLVNWIKSIKPKNSWKPSEEQMEALNKAKSSPANYYDTRLSLQSLYNDLKKL